MQLALLLVLSIVVPLVCIAALATGVRRLLGLRIGRTRAILTALVGLAAAAVIGAAMGDSRRGPMVTVQISLAVLAAMMFLALSEVVLPSGSISGVVRWPQAFRRRLSRTRRYTELSRIAVRHGLGRWLRARSRTGPQAAVERAALAVSLRMALEEAGATFIKMGQLLSTRYDLLPPEFVEELTRLQHQVPPEPWLEIEQVLTEELGRAPGEVFAEFDPEPLAAASIAQVHRARLHSGEQVVVKVQRPGARATVQRDLDILFRISRKLAEHTEWGRTVGAMELAEGFARSLHEELDFRVEARNTTAVRAGVAGSATASAVVLPDVHEEFSTQRVLILSWMDGLTLGGAGAPQPGEEAAREELAQQLLECMFEQIMFGGVFHSDPHPGNIMLLTDGRLALLDFGSVGRVDRVLRTSLRNLLLAIHRTDPVALCDALLELVEHAEEIDETKLERALGRFMARHLTPGVRPDREMFADLFLLVAKHGLTCPPEIAAAFRSLATLEGSMELLVPGFDIVSRAKGFAKTQVQRKLTPASMAESVVEEALAMAPMLRRLPRRVERITSSLEHGRLGVQVRFLADERDRRFVRTLVHEVLLTFIGAVLGLIGVLLLGTKGGPVLGHSLQLFQLLGYNLLVVASVLALRVVFSIFRADR
ncbi:ubiquinone biosynthesis protein UbiB [Streptomyces rubellomurinus subsp. indigoferus]|uniref:Ubiquinone biosynthesis protein UbiB n=1 Tax=Streptomyces rubellomurinus (strain ATCC 31215) TaxID=359131 RepID=A0A0F2T4P9_STRR3|nr:AarF/UbiB family protein [Streptomyces rubellomurinus]KJS52920.1 ubiquinone biosynthesis protein UbiB [Streptomyces rubellomurinus subsp. indigoferus]KJS58163.1 ubiquinone biosynthesis protein UbiB [Streptomyces rubellomurinus]